MDYEKKIAELLAKGEPMRKLDDDDPRKEELRHIVDEVNALRAEQEKAGQNVIADAPPKVDRAELEKQAGELGVKFDGRTTDALLQSRIDEALAK
jgi:hypothetical protein